MCEVCRKKFERGAQNLHCSHVFSRRHNSTRYSPENCFAHCFTCHQRLGGDPVNFSMWVEERIGPKKLEQLRVKAQLILKLTKQDKQYIAAHYRQQSTIMLEKRKQGHTGYLNFEHWG